MSTHMEKKQLQSQDNQTSQYNQTLQPDHSGTLVFDGYTYEPLPNDGRIVLEVPRQQIRKSSDSGMLPPYQNPSNYVDINSCQVCGVLATAFILSVVFVFLMFKFLLL